MAKIYQKTIASGTEKSLILDPKEALLYPFDIGADWTEARMGFLVSMVPADNDNTQKVSESITNDTPSNFHFFGLKNNDNTLPRMPGSLYLGHSGSSVVQVQSLSTTNDNWNKNNYHAYIAGVGPTVSYAGTLGEASANLRIAPRTAANTASFCSFVGLRFVIANRGASNQMVTIQLQNPLTDYSDTSLTALRGLITSTSYIGTSGTMGWVDGATARDIPNAIFIRMPCALNRLRIHSLMIERFA